MSRLFLCKTVTVTAAISKIDMCTVPQRKTVHGYLHSKLKTNTKKSKGETKVLTKPQNNKELQRLSKEEIGTERKYTGWSETGRGRAWWLASGKDPVWDVCDAIHIHHLWGGCSLQLMMPLCLYNTLILTNGDWRCWTLHKGSDFHFSGKVYWIRTFVFCLSHGKITVMAQWTFTVGGKWDVLSPVSKYARLSPRPAAIFHHRSWRTTVVICMTSVSVPPWFRLKYLK